MYIFFDYQRPPKRFPYLTFSSYSLQEENADFILKNRKSLVKRQDYTRNYKTGGNAQLNITFTGTHKATAGTVTFQVHGWTKNPLVEYHIIEYYTNSNQYACDGSKGTVTCDGTDYTIYEITRTNSPSIVGPRPSTSIFTTVANHFDAWKKAGMNLGEHDYQVLSTEGYNNAAGSRSQKIGTGPASYST
ncbi:endo-1,4-beta-xylanase B precursor [Hyaloscypha sp. PMI_1271]|nr:endo-1,4-beta-xylanase B precursor [Hyaloscypha sp. PMI_1271]